MSSCNSSVLLTGATGFLGSHLLEEMLNSGYRVVILKRTYSNTSRIDHLLCKVKSYDIDIVPLEMPFEEFGKFDFVVHTATNYGRNGETALQVFDANLLFPLRLLNISTVFNSSFFLNTSTILNANLSYYALSKRQFEDWGRMLANQGKVRFINIRLEHMYGPKDDLSKFTTWIVQSCIENLERIDLTPGKQKRDFIYIDDVVDAYLLLLKKSRQLGEGFHQFDLGSGKSVSISDFVKTVKKLTDADTELSFGAKPYRKNEIMKSEADISRLLELGWKPKYDLNIGLKKMIGSIKKVN